MIKVNVYFAVIKGGNRTDGGRIYIADFTVSFLL